MHAAGLCCTNCGWKGVLTLRYACPECAYSLEVIYDYEKVNRREVSAAFQEKKGVWDFKELLPVKNEENIITLGEGATPLLKSQRLKCGKGIHLYLKDETRNPTLSFKDRPNTVGISVAKELGFHDAAIASTGNGAASLAAYGARGGVKCHVFVPEDTPLGKVVQAMYHGADVIRTAGNYSDSFHRAEEECHKKGWANITSTYINPFTLEGDKTIAYEIFCQTGFKVPQWIIVPLGAGPMLSGVLKGFEELQILGFSSEIPKMAGVQAEGCAPIIQAFLSGEDEILPWGECHTIAGAIADPLTGYEKDGVRTVKAIRKSGGYGVAVSDGEIMESTLDLARKEAVLAEPASAASVAAVKKLRDQNLIKEGDMVIAMITAHGLKDGEELVRFLEKEEHIR